MSSQLQVTGEAKIRDIQGPVVANSGVITALDGAASQYVRGDGTLADFPTSSGGGSSVSYYLNSSVSQGTIGGVAYRELSKDPIIGAGTDIAISSNGYVANYITDVNDPDVTIVPGGNFNCEFYFSVNNNTGNPTTYAELYKYDGTTFTLLGTSAGVPESINQGTIVAPYYFAIPVATAALALTDRLAIRIYVNVDGRTVTLHTENGHLCQVVTTLSKGMVSLNNLTDQSQFLTTGTSGTNFAIASTGDTHTFNLPVASATNTGKLSSTDWSTFNNKQAALSFTAPLDNTSNTVSIPVATSLVDGYLDNLDWVKFNTAYNDSIISAAVTGTTTKTLTLNQQDGGTVTASWTDDNTDAVTSVFGRTGAVIAVSGDYNTSQVTELTNLYFTDTRARAALSLTTTGSSGASTYNNTTGVLNVPTYTLAGLGGVPTTRNITINGLTQDLSADRTWTITAGISSVSGTAPISVATVSGAATVSIATANTTTTGALTSTDWNTFNNKASTAALANYLPLSGGTLTGALVGTTANFSVNVNNSNSGLDLTNSGTLGYGNSINFYQTATKTVQIFTESTAPNTSEIEFRTLVGGTLAKRFKIEANGAGTFTSSVTASSLIKSGGTSSQFLKADGSVDSNTYVTVDTTQTISGVKTFSSVIGATASAVFNATGRATDYQYADMTNTSGRMIIGVDSSVGGSIIPLNSQPYSVSFGTDKNRFLHLFTSDLPRLNITGGGNVLIGTLTDGGYKLDVSAKGRFLSSVGAEVLRVEGPSTTDNYISVYSGGIHIFLDADYSSSGGIVGTQSNHPLIFRTNGANKARFSVNGNLLLNTTTDAGYKLDVNGTGRFTSNLTIGSGSLLILGNSDNANSMQIWNSQSGAANNLLIYDNAASAYRFVIGSNGNTAIGTSSPNDKLTIARNAADNSGGLTLYNENTSGYGSAISFRVNYAGVYNTSRIHGDWDTGNSGALHFFTANTSQSLVERMTINGVGNVLINTGGISGGGALQVNGNVNINGVFQINGTTIGGGGGSGVTGSGTSGYHSKWTGGTSLGNGVLYDDGTRIGLNTTSALTATRFQIDYSGSGNYGIFINQTTANEATMRFKSTHDANSDYRIGASILIGSAFEIYSTNAASTRFAVASDGNILINRITNAGYKLDVNGTGRFTGSLTGTDATFSSSVTAAGGFFDTSDSRLKIIIKDYNQAKGIEKVEARLYLKNNKKELGYFAQDVQEVLPSAVAEGQDGFLTLSYSQVHTAKIAYLEDKVAQLEELIKSLL